MNYLKKDEKGFTLIEIMVAIFVITIAFLTLEALTIATLKVNNESEAKTRASNVAVSILNKYENNLPTGPITGLPPREGFDWTVTPTYITPSEINLAVTISWNDHGKVKNMIVNRLVTTYQGN